MLGWHANFRVCQSRGTALSPHRAQTGLAESVRRKIMAEWFLAADADETQIENGDQLEWRSGHEDDKELADRTGCPFGDD